MVYPQRMSESREIPQLVGDLYSMAKEYLRQETIEPARRLTRVLKFGLVSGALLAVAALMGGLGVYALLQALLPDGEWWLVAARGGTAVVSLGTAALIVVGVSR